MDAPPVCGFCFGSGMEIIKGKGARPCRHIREKQREKLLTKFPARNTRFGVPNLESLKPFLPDEQQSQSAEVKEKIRVFQTRVINHVKANPFSSLNLCGKNKIGKSQIAFTVLLNAFDSRRNVKFFTMQELLDDCAKAAKQSFSGMSGEDAYKIMFVPRLTVNELTDCAAKYTILIDEFDSVIPSFTDSQMKTTFALLDAIKRERHQLILLSNYPFDWIRQGMYERKKYLGESVVYAADKIISRILEEADTDELFF